MLGRTSHYFQSASSNTVLPDTKSVYHTNPVGTGLLAMRPRSLAAS